MGYSLKGCCPWWQEEMAAGPCGSWSHCTCMMHSGSRHPQEVEWGHITNPQLPSDSFQKRGSTPLKVSPTLETVPPAMNQGSNESLCGTFFFFPIQTVLTSGPKCSLRKDCKLYVPFDCRRALWVVSPFFSLLCSF